ncbi:MAG TPA: hypothetical protein PLD25_13650 [Chloroflexota bacterium]|nr:hypothetical protein [Chloroflexota bacterium]HUM72031.1 hypothetical protein [Chloroflexota bacterium]
MREQRGKTGTRAPHFEPGLMCRPGFCYTLGAMEGKPVARVTSARIPTEFGLIQLSLYRSAADGKEHLALVMGEVVGQVDVLTCIS